MQNTTQSTDLTFVATCLLSNSSIYLVSVTQDFRGIKVFHLKPSSEVAKLQIKYAQEEILLSPSALANKIRQLKNWPLTEGGNNG